jgi:hypothetical protein
MLAKIIHRNEAPKTTTSSTDPILATNLEILINLRNKWLMQKDQSIEVRRNVMALNIVIINTERLIDPA